MRRSTDILRPALAVMSLAAAMLLTSKLLAPSGPDTTEGCGKDVKGAGQGIENAASDAEK